MKAYLFLLGFLVSSNAHAGGLLEPYVGYESGKFTADVTLGARSLLTISSTYSGAAYGLQGGIGIGKLILGADVAMASLSSSSGGSGTLSDIGALFGLFTNSVRMWGAYYFYSKSGDLKGTGYKGALGIKLMKHMSLNAEYMSRKYTAYAQSLPGLSVTGKFNSYQAIIGFPFGDGDSKDR